MLTRLTLLFVLAGALSFSSCKKDDDGDNGQSSLTLSYKQTMCADEWGIGASDAETVTKVETFFRSKGYPLRQVVIMSDGIADLCKACTCKTGKTIYAEISEAYIDEYKAYGFK